MSLKQLQNGGLHFVYQISDSELKYVDTKSVKFLNSIFNGHGYEAINLTLLMFLTQINFLRFVLNQLMGSSPHTLFKFKFIALYHLHSSL